MRERLLLLLLDSMTFFAVVAKVVLQAHAARIRHFRDGLVAVVCYRAALRKPLNDRFADNADAYPFG